MSAGDFARRLGLTVPIVQAPMAGETNTVALVVAASEAGALGSFGAAFTAPQDIEAAARSIRAGTNRPFAVNLFTADDREPIGDEFADACAALTPLYKVWGVEPPAARAPPAFTLDAQIEAVLAVRPAVFSFTFGAPSRAVIDECRRLGIVTIGTATNVAEIDSLEALGVDAICVQGAEAGGHRGTFIGGVDQGLIGALALTELAIMRSKQPILAGGGVSSARGVAAMRKLGAAAAQIGTLFLTTDEAGTSAPHRAALLAGGDRPTALTRTFTGRYARGIENEFMRQTVGVSSVAPHPAQRQVTAPIRAASLQKGDAEYIQLWAGQSYAACRAGPVSELIARLSAEL